MNSAQLDLMLFVTLLYCLHLSMLVISNFVLIFLLTVHLNLIMFKLASLCSGIGVLKVINGKQSYLHTQNIYFLLIRDS